MDPNHLPFPTRRLSKSRSQSAEQLSLCQQRWWCFFFFLFFFFGKNKKSVLLFYLSFKWLFYVSNTDLGYKAKATWCLFSRLCSKQHRSIPLCCSFFSPPWLCFQISSTWTSLMSLRKLLPSTYGQFYLLISVFWKNSWFSMCLEFHWKSHVAFCVNIEFFIDGYALLLWSSP